MLEVAEDIGVPRETASFVCPLGATANMNGSCIYFATVVMFVAQIYGIDMPIFVEPFLGTTGMIPAKPGYLQGLRDLADKYGILLVIDEVQGFRLSTGGARIRPEATGYGAIYYLEEVLKHDGDTIKGKRIAVSGYGNVA